MNSMTLWRLIPICLVIALVAPVSAQTVETPFHSFVWASSTLNGTMVPKVAVLVPIMIGKSNHNLYAQLDTGSDATIFYGKIIKKFGVEIDSTAAEMAFSWGEADSSGRPVQGKALLDWTRDDSVNAAASDPVERIIGTVGIDQIVGKLLLLDLASQTYAILSDTALIPPQTRTGMSYLPAPRDRSGRLHIDVLIGSDTLKFVLFDTGSASSTLTLPLADWQKATGLEGTEAVVIKDSIPAWGQWLQRLQAVTKQEIAFGQIHLKSPVIDCVKYLEPSLQDYKIIGLAPFGDKYVILLDCQQSRFGISLAK